MLLARRPRSFCHASAPPAKPRMDQNDGYGGSNLSSETPSSPYLKPNRLQDVITAPQFLGSHDVWRRPMKTAGGEDTQTSWDEKLKIKPISVEGDDRSWEEVFREHPEFFRIDSHDEASLVWRRAFSKEGKDRQRPPLSENTITKLIEFAIALHTAANSKWNVLEERKRTEQLWTKERELNERQWREERELNEKHREEERKRSDTRDELLKRQSRNRLIVSTVAAIVTALIAFAAAIIAAWISK